MNHVGDSASLTNAQVRYLNDQYFATDPTEYFEVRLWQLLSMPDARDHETLFNDKAGSLAAQFFGLLPEFRFVPDIGERESRMRATVIESLALRHHVAETTLRLYMALRTDRTDCRSPWFQMATDKSPDELNKFCRLLLTPGQHAAELREEVRRIAFPPVAEPRDGAELDDFITAIEEWLRHAAWTISEDGLDLGVAYNQVKHGLAIMATDKLRVDLLTNIRDPLHPTVGELNGGTAIINAPSIRYLDRHRPDKGHEFGWSLRTENADPAPTLAEAFMGIMTLRVLWKVGKVRFAPWHVVQPGEPIEYWRDPLPGGLLGRYRAAGARINWTLIPPRPKGQQTAGTTAKR